MTLILYCKSKENAYLFPRNIHVEANKNFAKKQNK